MRIEHHPQPPKQPGSNSTHPAGNYQYRFHYKLKEDLPASFEGVHGEVFYKIKCTIDRPLMKSKHKTEIEFQVTNDVDLNTRPNARASQSDMIQRNLCCLCCVTGPIIAEFHIDRSGHVPGEHIVLSGEQDVYRSEKDSTMFCVITDTQSKGEILPGYSSVWSCERICIPSILGGQCLSDMSTWSIIDLVYTIEACLCEKSEHHFVANCFQRQLLTVVRPQSHPSNTEAW
ncbi:hypothetical protein CAPTEDRAFT_196979 [Capitella teleta]|uniref:Arrestin-like N-terminal domain-containing protein n=1 Tax=Capitella teleta TaxID=283909 RepID=R7TB73_CAPTE|nr:hypothetical protein CAPTEDRAFT_196979 [Capitella teleta]|eukprot:ELT90988.1 hypothetical protein CAPTEDRAFT_196979 [Capitella teleta]